MKLCLAVCCLVGLATFTGCSAPSFLVTPVSNNSSLQEIQVEPARGWFAPKIALIEVEGMLANARTGGFLQAQENKLSLFTQQLDTAANDDRVKAVVLRVNSPGGTVTCSDTMYDMLNRFRKNTHKPVIVSAQEVMASGAFYTACGADLIVAQPTSVVGSIGVIFETFQVDEAMGKLGIASNVIKSGPLKDMGSPFKPQTVEERVVMQGLVDEYYARFLRVVQGKCHIADEQRLKMATDGRVFSGQQALALGLVDKLGSLADAINLAREKAGAKNAGVVMYKRPYGYSGSIYADSQVDVPQAKTNVLQLPLPEAVTRPTGFYYLWRP
jgi:protease-4